MLRFRVRRGRSSLRLRPRRRRVDVEPGALACRLHICDTLPCIVHDIPVQPHQTLCVDQAVPLGEITCDGHVKAVRVCGKQFSLQIAAAGGTYGRRRTPELPGPAVAAVVNDRCKQS